MKFVLVRLSSKISIEFCENVLKTLPKDWEGVLVDKKEQLKTELADANYVMGFPVSASFLKRNKNLKGIFLLSSQIPESYQSLSCDIQNITGINASAVAEHALYLILKALKDRGFAELCKNKTLGIMGFGAIGKEIFNISQPLFKKVEVLTRQSGHTHYDDYENFLKRNDIIVIALSYNQETKGLFQKENFFSELNSEIVLVNIARGELFNESDLVEFFNSHAKACYYTDVTFPEPYPNDGELMRLENVYITPHVAGFYQGLWDDVFLKWKECEWIK